MKTTTITTLILLVSLGLVVSGCFKKPPVNTNINQNVNQNVNQDTNTNQNVNAATSTVELENGWKKFIDKNNGFEISFPTGWQVRNFTRVNKYDCASVYYETQDQEKITKYTEALLASVDICKINGNNLISYLQSIGYQIDPDNDDRRVLVVGQGGGQYSYAIEKITFKGHPAILSEDVQSKGTYYHLDVQKDNTIYSITHSIHPAEFSKVDLMEIVNTLEFKP
ncbi:MAG: hypothetical protein HY979_03260 [Candidatus Magasanikbacteria bacterium]|nr:hypothetical protein [Candidatus Magasanikbacteria bacterium]